MSHENIIQQQIQQVISGGYPIAIMGESGQGKSTSLAGLNPTTSFIIDADKKGLPWRGWRQQWILGQNYVPTSDAGQIMQWLNHVNRQMPHMTTLVIDTLSAVMWDSEMARAREKGFEKWTDLAKSVYDIINLSLGVRPNLHVVCIFHSETNRGLDGGENWTKIRTSGKKLDTIVLESKFPIVLLAKSRRDDTGNHYFFETQAFCSTAKSPAGMFERFEIPNDLATVMASTDAYELGEPVSMTSTQLSPQLLEKQAKLREVVVNADEFLSSHLQFRFQVAKLEQLDASQHEPACQMLDALLRSVKREMKHEPGRPQSMEVGPEYTPSPRPSDEDICQLEQDVQKLDAETQQKLISWLKELGLNAIAELQNGRFQKVRLRVDQKLREAEIDAAERVVKLVELQKEAKIPMSFIAKYLNQDNVKTFTDLTGEAVQELLTHWESVKEAWKSHKPISPKQLKQLLQAAKENNLPEWALLRHLSKPVKLNDLKELPLSLFQPVIDNIPNLVEEMASEIATAESIEF